MDDIKELVKKQLYLIKVSIIKNGLEKLLVEPFKHLRDWDYGTKGEKFLNI